MLRSIFAILAGLAAWAGLWFSANLGAMAALPGAFHGDGSPHATAILIAFLALPVLFALAAGYITARAARVSGLEHAFILGLLLLAVGAAVQSMWLEAMPLWYHAGLLALLLPSVLVGARIYQGRRRRRRHAL